MALILILTAFPIGFFIRSRPTAYITYITAELFLFTFQSMSIVLDWAGGETDALGGPFPDYEMGQFLGYGLINLVIFAIGLGLVTLGARVRSRRRATGDAVDLAA